MTNIKSAAIVLALVTLCCLNIQVVQAQGNININFLNLFPESFDYVLSRGVFITSSLSKQILVSVNPSNGSALTLLEYTATNDTSGVGVRYDAARNRLLVVRLRFGLSGAVPPFPNNHAGLLAFNMSSPTPSLIFNADLTSPSNAGFNESIFTFANDVVIDNEGNAYVTDSRNPRIYKVTPTGEVTLWVENNLFSPVSLNNFIIGINGIDYARTNTGAYLVTGKPTGLYKIEILANGTAGAVTAINVANINASFFYGTDAVRFHPDGSLIVVAASGQVHRFVSSDNFVTATVTSVNQEFGAGTGLTFIDDDIYILHAHINDMFTQTPRNTFEIEHVEFSTSTTPTSSPGSSSPVSSSPVSSPTNSPRASTAPVVSLKAFTVILGLFSLWF